MTRKSMFLGGYWLTGGYWPPGYWVDTDRPGNTPQPAHAVHVRSATKLSVLQDPVVHVARREKIRIKSGIDP